MVHHPFKISLFFAVPMLVVAGFLQWINPTAAGLLPPGFHTPIIALEFIADAAEVKAFFTADNVNQLRNDFLFGNAIDYLFMFFYSVFLGFTALGIVRETGEKILWGAVALSMVVFFSDLLENVTIASIINTYFDQGALTASYFGNLHFFTWLKWGGIAAVFLMFSGYFFKKGILGKLIALLAVVNFVVAVIAFFNRSVMNEIMGMLVVFSFVLLFIHHIVFIVGSRKGEAVDGL
ncbi:MAG: hypothetical protein GY751_02890 [Bacteroidetes bacterium]|nr:hypothetical protein [Bacteroidota bacterium]